MNNEFMAVKNMFSAYLNQDFDLEFGSADEAILAFSNHSNDVEKELVLTGLNLLLNGCLDEKQMQGLILNDLGCCYFYPAEWESTAIWVGHIRSLLRG
ncbi:hypothetical protein HBN99_16455 [Pseudomonas oryzihabitans]|uniref:contact-dependent growth inhibition system immunity protein n=1 Tax=Pseudomonas oryzihabitans TaxID=47885 RepID=UPI0014748604|nr:contact-dependent growth inhibition system immunity protein [Pseudomonas oryzihabitans]NMZ65916.1 hypothetical protein [Pseudomonas oryzihabitans]